MHCYIDWTSSPHTVMVRLCGWVLDALSSARADVSMPAPHGQVQLWRLRTVTATSTAAHHGFAHQTASDKIPKRYAQALVR
jgi:hypothetical protein